MNGSQAIPLKLFEGVLVWPHITLSAQPGIKANELFAESAVAHFRKTNGRVSTCHEV